MTSDTTELRTTEQRSSPRDRVQLSAVQVAASALASVSAAVVASLFGVAGTVVGAGLVAVLSTTGSAIYSASMKRTSNQLRRAREQLLTARSAEGRRGAATAVLEAPTRLRRSHDDEYGGGFLRRFKRGNSDGDGSTSRWRRGWLTVGSGRGLKWTALAGAAVLVFAIAIGVVTLIEGITQKPISALAGNSTSG